MGASAVAESRCARAAGHGPDHDRDPGHDRGRGRGPGRGRDPSPACGRHRPSLRPPFARRAGFHEECERAAWGSSASAPWSGAVRSTLLSLDPSRRVRLGAIVGCITAPTHPLLAPNTCSAPNASSAPGAAQLCKQPSSCAGCCRIGREIELNQPASRQRLAAPTNPLSEPAGSSSVLHLARQERVTPRRPPVARALCSRPQLCSTQDRSAAHCHGRSAQRPGGTG